MLEVKRHSDHALCGLLVSLPGPGLDLGSGCLASGSNQPQRNWSRAITSLAQLVTPPGTRYLCPLNVGVGSTLTLFER